MEEVEISSINYVSLKWTKFRPETILSAESVDMTIATLDCNKIKVHQMLMSSISPFFANILKDIESPHYPVIVLTDIEFPEIQAICEFLYNGEVLVPADRVPLLMKAADKLQIKGLAREMDEEQVVEEAVPGEVEIENAVHDISTMEVENIENIDIDPEFGINSASNKLNERRIVVRRKIRKAKKERKSLFPMYPLKTATVATVASTDTAEDGTTTATLTTQVVPIVSTILIDTPVPVNCEICGVECENERILTAHRKIHQGKYIVYTPKDDSKKAVKHLVKSCPYCPYASEHVTSLSQHIRTHTGEKPYKCDICEKAFPRKTSLNDHMRSHTGERPFACDQCGKKFTQKHIMQNHIATVHSNGEKPFKCDYCDKCFTIKKALQKHIEIHKLKTIRKRIISNDNGEEIEEIIEEIEEIPLKEGTEGIERVSNTGKRGRPRKKKKKLINELTASDYSDESDPEFKCVIKPEKSITTSNSESTSNEEQGMKENENTNNDNEDDKKLKPTRIQPKRNAEKPRKSLSPSPPPPRPRVAKSSEVKPKEQKVKKKFSRKERASDPINASDYFYYKNSYKIDPPNMPNIFTPNCDKAFPSTEFIIEL